MSEIIICRGIQGSGKTTWAKQWVAQDPQYRIRINMDDIRNMFGVYWVPEREPLVQSAKSQILTEAMSKGYNVVLDNMNLNPKEIDWIKDTIKTHNNTHRDQYTYRFKDFFIPVEECILRDAQRPNPIGEEVIRNTWKKYRNFIIKEECNKIIDLRKQIEYNPELPTCVLCDLDATVAFRGDDRPFWGKECAAHIKNDVPDLNMLGILKILKSFNYRIIFLTGREDKDGIREASEKWLKNHFEGDFELIMRPENDYRPGHKMKELLYNTYIKDKYNVFAVFDDSKKVVDMYRRLGLFVLQPNEGKF